MRRALPLRACLAAALILMAAAPAFPQGPSPKAVAAGEIALLTAQNAQLQQAVQAAQTETAKYRDAYTKVVESAQQSRTEREQMRVQSDFAAAALTACEDKNVKLVKIGRDVISAYSGVGLKDVLITKEPVTGLKRLEMERLAQEYGDRVYEAKFDRRTVKPKSASAIPATPAPAQTPAAPAGPAQ